MKTFHINPLDRGHVMDGMLQQAIADARQSHDRALQQEALAWLWICCPDVADDLHLPRPNLLKAQFAVVAYADRYAAM